MGELKTDKPAGFGAGGSTYAGQQPGGSFGERAQSGVQQGGAQAKEQAKEIVQQARGTASQMADQAKSVVRSRVSEQAGRSAVDVADLARALRQTGRQLEGNAASPLVSRAADQLDRVAELLDTSDPDELVRNVERFAREQPWLFLGGAFALGIAGARFLKSSAEHAQSSAGELGGPGGEDRAMLEGFRP